MNGKSRLARLGAQVARVLQPALHLGVVRLEFGRDLVGAQGFGVAAAPTECDTQLGSNGKAQLAVEIALQIRE